jgi:biotin-(acetyl-CoA carboxylase) ligase
MLLQKICGVNLSLHNRKVHFTPKKHWASVAEALQKKSENEVCSILVRSLNEAVTYFIQNP